MEVKFSHLEEGTLGCVKPDEFLIGDEIIHISWDCPTEQMNEVVLHEMAHIIQFRRYSKKSLILMCGEFSDCLDFHDKEFWRILKKLQEVGNGN